MSRTYLIYTLGCKVNQYESDRLARDLEALGWTPVADGGVADAVIVNTCTVTGRASMQSRQAVRALMRKHPKARIAVTGCYAETAPNEIAKIEGVSIVAGNPYKEDLPGWLDRETEPRVTEPSVARQKEFPCASRAVFGDRARPFLKIQDGCNAFCSYCIVPHARGRSRSMPPETVVAHLRELHSLGFGEAVLTGIHLGAYGQDLSPRLSLTDLLEQVLDHGDIPRMRLSSIEPNEVADGLVRQMARSEKICPHMHLPLQSGSNRILERMRRPYSRERFAEKVHAVTGALPFAAVGCDILAGFPGETETDFLETLRLVESLPVTYTHVFPFSPRPGTPAARYPDQVPPPVLKERTAILRKLGQEKRVAFYESLVGREVAVCVEARQGEGRYKGTTENYAPAIVRSAKELASSSLVRVRVTAARGAGGVTAKAG